MPQGGEIEIRAWQEDQRVNIAVRDNGCGISASLRKRIFEPFFTTHSEIGLAGLGLTTVRSIMSTHDGLVGIDSIPGKGSTFRLNLPVLALPENS
jgi:two-component system NtrC family sensor kinase